MKAVMFTLFGQQRDSITTMVQWSDDNVHIVELTLLHTHTERRDIVIKTKNPRFSSKVVVG